MNTIRNTKILAACLMAGIAVSCAKDNFIKEESPIILEKLSFEAVNGEFIAATGNQTRGVHDSIVAPALLDTIHREAVIGLAESSVMYMDLVTEDMDPYEFGAEETKSAPATSVPNTFNFWRYAYTGTWSTGASTDIANETAIKSGSAWQSEKEHTNTPSTACKHRYYAYFPAGCSGLSVSFPNFIYTVPASSSSQSDLAFGVSGDITATGTSPVIAFEHALSQITFQTGSVFVPCTLKSITLKGVYGKATYNIGSGWGSPNTTANFTAADLSKPLGEAAGVAMLTNSQTFMMLPQTVPAGATLEIVVNDGADHTLSVPIAGDVWSKGKKHVYTLSVPSMESISISPVSASIPYGSSKSFTVSPLPSSYTEWTHTLTGTGLSATKSGNVITVSNNNTTGTDATGTLKVTSQSGNRTASASITAVSLQESISITPTTASISNGASATFTVSGTYPNGYTVTSSDTELTVSKSGNTITATNRSTSTSSKAATITVKTGIQNKTATATVTMSRANASFSGVSPTSLIWNYNDNTTTAKITVSGSNIVASDISLSSLSHFTATVTNATTISVKPKAINSTSAAYRETLQITIGGVTKSVTLTQYGQTQVSSYGTPVITAFSYPSKDASAGSVSPSITYTQTVTYASGNTSTITSGASISYAVKTANSAATLTTSTGVVAWTANTGSASRSCIITATVTMNGKSATKDATSTQTSDMIIDWGTPVITSFSYPSITYDAAGSASPSIAYTQTVTYASGNTGTITSGGIVTYSMTAGNGFTINTSTGVVSVGSNVGSVSTTVDGMISINSFSYSGSIGYAGGSSSAPSISYAIPYTQRRSATAARTSNKITATVTMNGKSTTSTSNVTVRQNGDPGATLGTGSYTTGATVTYSVSGSGFSVNSSTGVVTAGSNAGASTTSYSTPTVNMSYNPTSFTSSGGTASGGVTSYSQTKTVTRAATASRSGTVTITVSYSGATAKTATASIAQGGDGGNTTSSNITTGATPSYSLSSTSGFSLSGSNVVVSANTGAARSTVVTGKVTLNGKTGSATQTISQAEGSFIFEW